MTNDRMDWAFNQSEPATYTALRMLGYEVQVYGQAMLPPAARGMLRGVLTPQRWVPDFLVSRPPVTDRPRWPTARRGKYTFLIDAKYSWGKTRNHAVEMRSLVAASTFGMDVYYVCSQRHGDECTNFGAIRHDHVLLDYRPCCLQCKKTMLHSQDPMRELPEHCPSQPKNKEASGTPYVVFPAAALLPLSAQVFDLIAMSYVVQRRPTAEG